MKSKAEQRGVNRLRQASCCLAESCCPGAVRGRAGSGQPTTRVKVGPGAFRSSRRGQGWEPRAHGRRPRRGQGQGGPVVPETGSKPGLRRKPGAGQGRACAASWRRSRAGFQNQELFVFIGARGQQKAWGRWFQESGGKWSPESNAPVKAHRCRSQFQGARGLKTKQAGIETAGRQRIMKPTKRGETDFRPNPATRGHGNTEYPGPGQGGM